MIGFCHVLSKSYKLGLINLELYDKYGIGQYKNKFDLSQGYSLTATGKIFRVLRIQQNIRLDL